MISFVLVFYAGVVLGLLTGALFAAAGRAEDDCLASHSGATAGREQGGRSTEVATGL